MKTRLVGIRNSCLRPVLGPVVEDNLVAVEDSLVAVDDNLVVVDMLEADHDMLEADQLAGILVVVGLIKN